MKKYIILVSFLFCSALPFFVAVQAADEVPKTVEDAQGRLARSKAETERLRAELMRLRTIAAQQYVKPVSSRAELPRASGFITNKGPVRPNGTWTVDYGTGTVNGCITKVEGGPSTCYIVTAAHVVSGSQQLLITFFDGDKVVFQGKPQVVISDPKNDIAILRIISPVPLPVTAIASENYKPKKGDAIIAVGSPKGIRPHVYTGPNDRIRAVNAYNNFENITLSCPSDHGASGGGIFNAKGELIAICSASDATTNVHTGIPELYDLLSRANAGIAISNGLIIESGAGVSDNPRPIILPSSRP